jgi:Effector-associated domain 10
VQSDRKYKTPLSELAVDRDLDAIFDQIAKRNATDEDLHTLRQLRRVPEGQCDLKYRAYLTFSLAVPDRLVTNDR